MAFLTIPTPNNLPAFTMTVSLDGTNYQLDFQWNSRMNNGLGKWMVAIADAQGNPLIDYVPIVATWPLFNRFKFDGLPGGTLFAFDSSGKNEDPGQFDLGKRVQMLYLEAGT